MFMASLKRKRKKPAVPPTLICTHSLTPDDVAILQRFSHEASDQLGWTVSGSAMVRALLRHAKQQGSPWVAETLVPLIEEEIQSGIVWGKKK